MRKIGKNMAQRLALAGAVLAISVSSLMAQMSGTNAVGVLEDNIINARDTVWPIVITIVVGLVALNVFMKIGKKAGARA